MIKLIASDMDGTLLTKEGHLPKNFFMFLQKLLEIDVKFVVASGRSYPILNELFKPFSDKIYYICDNGAFVKKSNNIIYKDTLNKSILNDLIEASKDIQNSQLILCGLKGAYHTECKQEMLEQLQKYYINDYTVSNLFDIDDEILKVSICDLNNSAQNSYKILNPKFKQSLDIIVSGDIWLDIMNKGISKGKALEQLQKSLNISYKETMVFGDFYNDIEMLKKAYYSFVMDNANNDIKQYGNFIAKSNEDNGVMRAIYEYVLK